MTSTPPASAPPAPSSTPPSALQAAPASDALILSPRDPRQRWSLVVSFGSECCGTDREAAAQLQALVASLPTPPRRARGRWGKEGEMDDCFDLAPLAPADRERFIARVQKEIVRKLVTAATDAKCRHER
jgi:hypothetical protein